VIEFIQTESKKWADYGQFVPTDRKRKWKQRKILTFPLSKASSEKAVPKNI
jgi:hypothetical protein